MWSSASVSGMKETVVIEALAFPTICTPLPSVAKIDCCAGIKKLELADSSIETSDEIDLFVGSDHYWSIPYTGFFSRH